MLVTQILLVASIFVKSHVVATNQIEGVDRSIEPNEFLSDKPCNSLVISASQMEGHKSNFRMKDDILLYKI